MIKDLTIIIPPHNRHRYLKRILMYYADLDVKILIADSSETEYPEREKLNKNIEYFFLKGFSFAEKMHYVIGKVNTKYTLIIAEDDFYIAKSIGTCVEFLNNNPSYASCQGNYTFFIDQKPFIHYPGYLHSYKRDVNAETSFERLNQLFASYFQLFYCVHTTSTLKDLFEFSHHKIKSMFSIEILLACCSLIEGKHKVLPIYYGSRERITTSVGQTQDDFFAISRKKKYKEEYNRLRIYLAGRISKADQISHSDALIGISHIFTSYFKSYYRFYYSAFLTDLYKTYIKIHHRIRGRQIAENQILTQIIDARELEGFPQPGNTEEQDWNKIQSYIQASH